MHEDELRWKEKTLQFELTAESEREEFDISSLDFVPLEYPSPETQQTLKDRGQTFWRCRNRRLVSYEASSAVKNHALSDSCLSNIRPATLL
jgi:hypothetical protein